MISVVIPSYNARTTIARCLQSLRDQTYKGNFEVIVVDSSTDGTADVIAKAFPEVQLCRSARRLFPGDARNLGIARSTGDILAFLDADCMASPNWLEEIARAHRTSYAAIGGVTDNGNPESYVGWASYFCKFSQWMPQPAPRQMVEIPTTCLSVKRWAYDAYGPFLEGIYCSDTAFHWKLGQGGHAPWLFPSIRVTHVNRDRLVKFLTNEPRHGRYFAQVRTAERHWSTPRRLAFAVLTPLLPLVLFARTAARVFRFRTYRGRFLLASPLVFVGHAAWCYGELRGYLATPMLLTHAGGDAR